MSESPGYRAFLSYSHCDRKWADWLHRSLESYRVPPRLAEIAGRELPRRIAPVFRDREELPSAPSLSAEVNRALEASESLIVICSPSAAASNWVNEEIATFQKLGRADRIFCLIVAGEPNTGDETECFPRALRVADDEVASGRPLEPIAADARPQGDGRTLAKLKLIAGILNVGFDALRQRDLHRRNRRLLAITAGSVVMMLVTVTLAVLAIVARAESEQRREQAEDLIGFMVGDLRTRLQEIGRLDIFMSVGDEVMDYFAEFTDEEVGDSMLDQRATALRQIGEIRLDQGEIDAAIVAFRESVVISSRLAERDPKNANWQIGLANSYFYIGYVHWQRGELSAARVEFESILPIVDGVVASDPDNPDWLAEQGYAYTNVGRILELESNFEQALEIYGKVMEINVRLRDLQPDNIDWQLEVGFSHNNLGKLVTSLGRITQAEEHYRQDLAIKKAISDSNPQHNLWRYYLAVAHAYLARINGVRGDFVGAKANFGAAMEIMSDLVRLDSSQLSWMRQHLNLERELAVVLRQDGEDDEAYARISSAIAGLTALTERDDSNALWAQDLTLARIEAARQELRRGDVPAAMILAESSRQSIAKLLQQGSDNRDIHRCRIAVALAVGDIAMADGDVAGAGRAWREALDVVDQEFAETADPAIIDLRATLLQHLDRDDEAAGLMSQLRAIGYRSQFVDSEQAVAD